MVKSNNNYNADSIQTLEGLAPFRKSPAMYIGNTSDYGLFHVVKEIVNNSVDEFMNSEVTSNVTITLLTDGGIQIKDNGRGFPHGMIDDTFSILGGCFGKEHTGGKFNNSGTSGYNSSGGMHGIGCKCAAALGKLTKAISYRDGIEESVEFSQGKMLKQITNGKCDKALHGTIVTWYPDPEIFETITFDMKRIEKELCQEYSFLNSGLEFTINNEKEEYTKSYLSHNGIADYIDYLNGNNEYIMKPIILKETEGDFSVEIGIAYNNKYSNTIRLYTNSIPQTKGTHLTGFKTAWTSAINTFAKENKLLKAKDSNLTGSDLEEGQILVINFKMIDPKFDGQIKENLSSTEGRTYVQKLVSNNIQNYFTFDTKGVKNVIEKALGAKKAADAARKAREAAREGKKARKKKVFNPDKLKDAEHLGKDSILLIVEGNSAAASMAVARDTSKYGILGLRGKLINAYTNKAEKLNANEEIQLLLTALGVIPGAYNSKDLRYGKIAICTDSDSDGFNIGMLVMAAIEHFLPEMIDEKRLCWLRSPLWIVKNGKSEEYYYTDEEMNAVRKSGKIKGEVQRNKGLGSLSAEQAHNSMFTDRFQRLDVLEPSEAAIKQLRALMGADVTPRKEFVFNNIDFSTIQE